MARKINKPKHWDKLKWFERLRYQREKLGLYQADIANKTGLTQATISQYETGTRDDLFTLSMIANAIDIPVEELGHPAYNDIFTSVDLKRRIPVISWDEINEWTTKKGSSMLNAAEFLSIENKTSNEMFALQVQGDAMTSNNQPNFVNGSYIINDPTLKPEIGDIVVVELETLSKPIMSFKKLDFYDGDYYLTTLNPAYNEPIRVTKNVKIKAVVVECRYKLKFDLKDSK